MLVNFFLFEIKIQSNKWAIIIIDQSEKVHGDEIVDPIACHCENKAVFMNN